MILSANSVSYEGEKAEIRSPQEQKAYEGEWLKQIKHREALMKSIEASKAGGKARIDLDNNNEHQEIMRMRSFGSYPQNGPHHEYLAGTVLYGEGSPESHYQRPDTNEHLRPGLKILQAQNSAQAKMRTNQLDNLTEFEKALIDRTNETESEKEYRLHYEEGHDSWMQRNEEDHRRALKLLGYERQEEIPTRRELDLELMENEEAVSEMSAWDFQLWIDEYLSGEETPYLYWDEEGGEDYGTWIQGMEDRHRWHMREFKTNYKRFLGTPCEGTKESRPDTGIIVEKEPLSNVEVLETNGSDIMEFRVNSVDYELESTTKGGCSRQQQKNQQAESLFFDGKKVSVFLRKYENAFDRQGLTAETKVEKLPSYVHNRHLHTVRNLPGFGNKSWVQLKRSMKEAFLDIDFEDLGKQRKAEKPKPPVCGISGSQERTWSKRQVSIFFEKLVEKAEAESFTVTWAPQKDQAMYFDVQPLGGEDSWMAVERVTEIANELMELDLNEIEVHAVSLEGIYEESEESLESENGQPLVTN
ncbi:hypothetical protein P7C70_g9147, partial [Phenoliferia sp. Uapishka_3]